MLKNTLRSKRYAEEYLEVKMFKSVTMNVQQVFLRLNKASIYSVNTYI